MRLTTVKYFLEAVLVIAVYYSVCKATTILGISNKHYCLGYDSQILPQRIINTCKCNGVGDTFQLVES